MTIPRVSCCLDLAAVSVLPTSGISMSSGQWQRGRGVPLQCVGRSAGSCQREDLQQLVYPRSCHQLPECRAAGATPVVLAGAAAVSWSQAHSCGDVTLSLKPSSGPDVHLSRTSDHSVSHYFPY